MHPMRHNRTIIATVNGYEIVRTRIGAATWRSAEKIDQDGYVVAAFRDLSSRRAAEAKARDAKG